MEELKEGWRRVKLENLTNYIARGIPPKYSENLNDMIVINQKCIRDGKLSLKDSRYHNYSLKKVAEEKILKKYDILINSTGVGTLGRVCQNLLDNENLIVDTHVTIVRPNLEKINPIYLGFAIRNNQKFIESLGEGSTGQTELKRQRLADEVEIFYPEDIKTQEKIASILSALDDKIEINNEMNKTLEEMAQTLFKRWFIDFDFPNENGEPYRSSGGKMVDSELGEIPEGWEVNKYGALVKLNGLNTKKGNHLRDLPYVPIDCIPKKSLGLQEFKSWKEAESSLQLFNENDILFGAMRAYFHKVVISPFKGVTRKTCFILTPLEENDLSYVTLLTFQESTIDYANSNSKGTTMPYAVWENGLENMSVINPPQNIKEKFNSYVYPLLNSIKSSLLSNKSLTEIRDTLLPKLMSGEIEV